MVTKGTTQVLMICLDGAEPHLIEQWMNDNTMSNLKCLSDRGIYSRLASTADLLAGSPWPTFFTGTNPADHGMYHSRQWRADRMHHSQVSPDWLRLRPFWREFSETGHRVIAVDVPMTFSPDALNGVEISSWASHDRLVPPSTYPTSILDSITEEVGKPPKRLEVWGPMRVKSLFKLRDHLIQVTNRVTELTKWLMSRENWDLFIVSFGATHTGGHKLWDLSGAYGDILPSERIEFSHALQLVYKSCDEAVGKIVEAVGDQVTILIFSLHGMGPNSSRNHILQKMLDLTMGKKEKLGNNSQIQRWQKSIPIEWKYDLSHIFKRLPRLRRSRSIREQERESKIKWDGIQAFSIIADLQGYIRINLRGREADGIVEPGKEYNMLCNNIMQGLRTFVDADSYEPIVESVTRSDQLYKQGSRVSYLPDLIVSWASSKAAKHRTIKSPIYGFIKWPTPGRNPNGRSGNHRKYGFILATGNNCKPLLRKKDPHILDLAPTVYSLFNVPKPVWMCGNTILIN
jgi:predicted AlkP superfamily phosphohydrolase/phosphomutase